MITLAHTTKNYDVEFEGNIYNFEVLHDTNSDHTEITVFFEGDDVTDWSSTQDVKKYFEENIN